MSGNGERPMVVRWRSAVIQSELSNATKVGLMALADFMDANGRNARPSIETLASYARVSTSTAAKARAEGISKGWLVSVRQGGSRAGGERATTEVAAAIPTGEREGPAVADPAGDRVGTGDREGLTHAIEADDPRAERERSRTHDLDNQDLDGSYRSSVGSVHREGDCHECDSTGWVLDGDGVAHACQACRRVVHPEPIPLPQGLLDMPPPGRTPLPEQLRNRHDVTDDDLHGDEPPF